MAMHFERSEFWFQQASQVIPGGVNSPVRAFRSVGGTPLVIEKAEGAFVYDVDGQQFLDLVGAWGPALLGHAPKPVQEKLQQALANGFCFGMLSEGEVHLAQHIVADHPSLDQIRLTCSGTEAVMTALRLARAHTQRSLILKFEGGYHGHADGLLSAAGSGLATCGIPSSPGVPAEYAALTLTLPFNDLQALRDILKSHGPKIAALIGEPIPANMGVVLPHKDYWQTVRDLLHANGSLLIFDEVITGYRMGLHSAQGKLGVTPDLTTFGKIIGGGLPVGAVGGKRILMEQLAPLGKVYQAGTLSGNPLTVTAGRETLRLLHESEKEYERLEKCTALLADSIRAMATVRGINVQVNHYGSLLTVFFAQEPVTDFASACRSDTKRYGEFFHHMLQAGILLPPSQFEAWFFSMAMSPDLFSKIEQTIDTVFTHMSQ